MLTNFFIEFIKWNAWVLVLVPSVERTWKDTFFLQSSSLAHYALRKIELFIEIQIREFRFIDAPMQDAKSLNCYSEVRDRPT